MKALKIEIRKLIGWVLLGWVFKVMPKGSQEKYTIAAAIKMMIKNEK
jgi:hypothetical protein